MAGTATCSTCDWTDNGDPITVDTAADKHTRVKAHSTAVAVSP